jgi:hypothetical protein
MVDIRDHNGHNKLEAGDLNDASLPDSCPSSEVLERAGSKTNNLVILVNPNNNNDRAEKDGRKGDTSGL